MAPTDPPEVDGRRKRASRLEEAISNPGAVKINVTGAFIVDDEPRSRSPIEADGVHYENKDIRLPHHTGVVSHVAVDVSCAASWCSCAPHMRPVPRNPLQKKKKSPNADYREPPLTDCTFRLEDHSQSSSTSPGNWIRQIMEAG